MKGIRPCPKPVMYKYPEGDVKKGFVIKEFGEIVGNYYAVIQFIKYIIFPILYTFFI